MPLRGSSPKRYAEALLELADERRAVAQWRASLERLASTVDRETLRLLGAPRVSFATRRAALERAIAEEPVGVRALLLHLLERDRLTRFPDIVRAFRDLLDAREGIVKGVITTAVPLDESARRELLARLEKATGRKLRATFAVDPAILGGTIVRLGDRQVDASLRGRLARLREHLAGTAS